VSINNKTEGFGLSCDQDGMIVKLFYDNYGIDSIETGKLFLDMVDEGSIKKASNFLKKIKDEYAVYDWELDLICNHKLKIMHLSGFSVDGDIIIFGAPSLEDIVEILKELTRTKNEPNAIFSVMQSLTSYIQEEKGKKSLKSNDITLYHELGRLNNELTNTKRELTKKNIELTELNQQKEMLLKEIHHRVKNNLMIISSLLNLQSRYIKDKESQEIFKESQNRAQSMALIHQRLYQSTDLKNIDFKEYITTLANDLYRTYVDDTSRVSLTLNIDECRIDINTAIPLGLILNELITNSMKHAFPGNEKGTINIDFKKNDDKYILIVSDDGVGFPEDLDYQKTDSLGLQLVNNLTDQISGELELDTTRGTTFKITFKENKI
jgi:two-component sensor histidine kinase